MGYCSGRRTLPGNVPRETDPLIYMQPALTNSKKQKRGIDNSYSPCQEIRRILLKPEAHYRVNKIPPPFPVMSHTNLVHVHILFIQEHFNIILRFTRRFLFVGRYTVPVQVRKRNVL